MVDNPTNVEREARRIRWIGIAVGALLFAVGWFLYMRFIDGESVARSVRSAALVSLSWAIAMVILQTIIRRRQQKAPPAEDRP